MNNLPKYCLWALFAISIVIALLFALGGSDMVVLHGDEFSEPKHTGLLLNWTYVLTGLALGITLLVSVISFVKLFAANPKKAITILVVLAVFALIFVISWVSASGERINIIGYEGTDNEGTMARYSEMCLFVAYILSGLTILSVIFGAVKGVIKK